MADMWDDDDDDDDDLFLEYLDDVYPTAARQILDRAQPFDEYDEDKFRERFRIRKETALHLLSEIEAQLEYPSDRNKSISPINQLLITLRFYATGTFQLVLGDVFGIDKSTTCRIIHKVTRTIASLRDKYVKFPANRDERRRTMEHFYAISGMPGVIGAVDCTHIPIQSGGGDDGEIYRNRKGYFSINVQLVCNQSLYITNVVARWPGSVHDSTIFDFSNMRAQLETEEIPDGCLVGDGGYASRKYMLTPLLNPVTPSERAYNRAQISARNCIERTNGVLKRRFPALKYGLRLKVQNILPVIVAVVVCHNIATVLGETVPPDDVQLEEYIQRKRQQGIQVDFDPVEALPQPVLQVGGAGMRRSIILNHF